MKRFLSGDEALAEGVRLARPQVISAYPITPQTVVVERLSEMVEDGSLAAEYVHVESEHSALSCAIGASATGARTFTATSSQGLLYMAECLTYASGGRFPIVMMNANRATALPWNIYGDQRDSLSLLDHGWIQVYAENDQEALDLALMAYAVAEDPAVRDAGDGEPGRLRAHAHLRDGGRSHARAGRRVPAALRRRGQQLRLREPGEHRLLGGTGLRSLLQVLGASRHARGRAARHQGGGGALRRGVRAALFRHDRVRGLATMPTWCW